MKLAFITTLKPRNGSFYGAETSLKYLINSVRKEDKAVDITIIVRQPFIPWRRLKTEEIDQIAEFFNVTRTQLILTWIPYVTLLVTSTTTIKAAIRYGLTSLLLMYKKHKLRSILVGFDHVHINNTHLYMAEKCIPQSVSFSQHVRDSINNFTFLASRADFFLAIDNTTFNKMPVEWKGKGRIIMNSYEVVVPETIPESLCDISRNYRIVFCIVGMLEPIKGVDYVISEFVNADVPYCALLVVGGGQDSDFVKYVRDLGRDSTNIFYTGDVKDMAPIYHLADFNIRGDEYFCIGRTTIEATYHGMTNIMPQLRDEKIVFPETPLGAEIQSHAIFYEARKTGALAETLRKCCIDEIRPVKIKLDSNSFNEIPSEFFIKAKT